MKFDHHRAQLLQKISALGFILSLMALIMSASLGRKLPGLIAAGLFCILFLVVFVLNHVHRPQSASLVFAIGMWVFFTALTLLSGGIHALIFTGQMLTIIISGALLGKRASFYTMLATAGTAVLLMIAESVGFHLQLISLKSPVLMTLVYVGLFVATSSTLNALLHANEASLGTLRESLFTEKKQKEVANNLVEEYQSLYEKARFTQFAVDNAADAAYWLSKNGTIIYANLAASRMLGYQVSDLIGKSVLEIDRGMDKASWRSSWTKLIKRETAINETIHIHNNGTQVPVEVTANYVVFDGDEYSCCFVRDISKRKAIEKKLLHLATHDHLTQLPNRVLLHDRLSQSIEKARRAKERVALLLFDLDGFKRVNDDLGHAYGDIVLCEIAHRLTETLRASDTISRLGGDEFTVMIEKVKGYQHLHTVATKVLDSILQPFELEEREYCLTASMGIAIYPTNGDNADRLLRVADMAMYQAKSNGGHYVIADPENMRLDLVRS